MAARGEGICHVQRGAVVGGWVFHLTEIDVDDKTKNFLTAVALAGIIAYAIGWLTISQQQPIPGIDQLSAVVVTLAVGLVAFSWFKRNPL